MDKSEKKTPEKERPDVTDKNKQMPDPKKKRDDKKQPDKQDKEEEEKGFSPQQDEDEDGSAGLSGTSPI